MANALGIGVVGWSPLGGGLLTGKYRRGETGRATDWNMLIHREDDERKKATVDAVLSVAEEVGKTPGQVALAWVASKGVLPILGPRTAAQLDDNLGAAHVRLGVEQIERLDRASAISSGFPHDMIAGVRAPLVGGDLSRVEQPSLPVA
ncbi:MAG: aldo/keto reductase [Labilithrix sp.]|nr:aldo/keto reductase [Labilithrix sp.]